MKNLFFSLLLVVGIFVPQANAARMVQGGDIPPDYLGADSDGRDVRVRALRGKVVVITFWASWCGYCLKELPVLEKIQRVAGKADLEVVAINQRESTRLYRKMLARLSGLSLTMTHDRYGKIGDAYGVVGIPHLVMVDREGEVAYVHRGYNENMLDGIIAEINELLAEPRPLEAEHGTPVASRSD